MYTEMYCGKKIIHSLHPSGGYVLVHLFICLCLQSISRCDAENSTFRIWLVTLARYLCECQIPMSKYKEDVRVFNINTVLEAGVKNSY